MSNKEKAHYFKEAYPVGRYVIISWLHKHEYRFGIITGHHYDLYVIVSPIENKHPIALSPTQFRFATEEEIKTINKIRIFG